MSNTVDFIVEPAVAARAAAVAGDAPWPRRVTLAVAVALALVCYLPAALRAEFLAFDDNFFFGPDNFVFRDGLAAVLDPGRPIANAWLPVAHASLWFDWWWFGGSPTGPHLHSLALHALTGFVLVRLLLRLGVRSVPAHLAGALFLVHPALAESVAWVSGRKDLLAGLFVLGSLHATVGFAHRGGAMRAALAVTFAALAMYSKATAVVLPGFALLVCLLSGGHRGRYLVVALQAVACAAIAWHHQAIAAAEGTMLAGDADASWQQVPGACLHYLRAAVWPAGLNVLYPEVQTLERFRAALWPAFAVLAGLGAFGLGLLARRGRWRLVGGGIGAFLVALVPFNTAFPASSIAAADRYLHLAVPGLAVALAVAAALSFGRAGLGVLALALLPLGYLCGVRAHDFTRTERLWRSSLAVDDDNAVAHFNLARELMTRDPLPLEEAERHLDAAVRAARYPVHELRARRVLRAIDMQRADYDGAAAQARAAIAAARAQLARETSPRRRAEAQQWLVAEHLAAFEPLRLSGDQASAAASYRAAVAVEPDNPEVVAFGALLELAEVAAELTARASAGGSPVLAEDDARALAADRTLDAALAACDEALAARPRDPVLLPARASLLVARASWARVRGQRIAALGDYRRAQAALRDFALTYQASPPRIDAWLEAARMLREQELFADAARHAQDGLQFRQDPALRQEWAMALVGQGQLDDAIMQLEAYLKQRPRDTDTCKVLSNILAVRAYARLSEGAGGHEQARHFVERALEYNPREVKAHLVLGRIAYEQRRFAAAVEQLEIAHRTMPEFEDARRLLTDALRDLGFERWIGKDLVGAGDAWLRCLEVAPAGADVGSVRMQLAALWRQHKEAGIAFQQAGDLESAIAEFRRCQVLDPENHLNSWLLAMALRDRPDVDLEELERLCREAVAWEEEQGRDASLQVYLLARTLIRRGRPEEARVLAVEWAKGEHPDADPQVRAALEQLAGS